MPRNSTTSRNVPKRVVRKTTGRRKPAAARPGDRQAAMQQPQQAPDRQPDTRPAQHQQLSALAWQEPVDDASKLDERLEWQDTVRTAQEASKARQRIEMLREDRLLQQALIDTFDL